MAKKKFGVSYVCGTDHRLVVSACGWFTMVCDIEEPQSLPTEEQLASALASAKQQYGCDSIVPLGIFPLAISPETEHRAE